MKTEQNIMKVVGTIFIDDNKILIDKPRKRSTYQMIGGRVENNESPLQAAIRECHEELGEKAVFDETLFESVMDFEEKATSNPNQKIHFYVFYYKDKLKGSLTTSEEIESFLWYDSSLGSEIISNTLKNEVIPYCIEKKLIK